MDLSLKIINYNDIIKQTNEEDVLKFTQNPELLPQHPFRAIVFGASGSGKSNLLLNLLTKGINFTKLYLYAPDLTEDKYMYLIKHFSEIEKTTNTEILYLGTSIKDIVSVDELDKNEMNVVVFDDFLNAKNQDIVNDYMIRSRKKNTSVFYLAQVFHKIPKTIRDNSNYMFLFGVSSNRELNNISYTMASDLDIKDFKKIYIKATSIPYGFLMIDKRTTDNRLKYRSQLNGIIQSK